MQPPALLQVLPKRCYTWPFKELLSGLLEKIPQLRTVDDAKPTPGDHPCERCR
jgi:hypothetical protein